MPLPSFILVGAIKVSAGGDCQANFRILEKEFHIPEMVHGNLCGQCGK
jgi:hypothetical protein